jgi:hypothetical protein
MLGGHVKKTQEKLGDPSGGAIVCRKFFNGDGVFIYIIVMLL